MCGESKEVSSKTSVCTTSPFLVAIIVSLSVSKTPTALYVVCPAESGKRALLFVLSDVSLNSNSPHLNFG